MASTRKPLAKSIKPPRVYRLYTRCAAGDEPSTWVNIPEYAKGSIKEIGTKTVQAPKFGVRRGALIWECNSYKALVAHAQECAVAIGMPKSRIWDIFDWNV